MIYDAKSRTYLTLSRREIFPVRIVFPRRKLILAVASSSIVVANRTRSRARTQTHEYDIFHVDLYIFFTHRQVAGSSRMIYDRTSCLDR